MGVIERTHSWIATWMKTLFLILHLMLMLWTKLTCLKFCFSSLGMIAASVAFASNNPVPVVLQLDWVKNVQFAGIFQAVEQGFYKEAGMELEIRPVPKEGSSVDVVLYDPAPYIFGVAESTVLLQGGPGMSGIKAIATMFQDSPLGWMSLKSSGIQSISDFKGKRVGVHSDGVKALELALNQAGLSLDEVQTVEVGGDPAILVKGDVDLMQGYYVDEFVRLQLLSGSQGKIILARDHGYMAYSQVIITTGRMMEEHHDLVKSFLRASREGWKYALQHVEETADLIITKHSPELDRNYQIASLRRIADMVSPPWPAASAPHGCGQMEDQPGKIFKSGYSHYFHGFGGSS